MDKFVWKKETPIEFLNLNAKTYNSLLKAKVFTIGDILKDIENGTLIYIQGIGKIGRNDIMIKMEKNSLLNNF